MVTRRGVYWLKRDLRLRDNPALTSALDECDELRIVFLYEPSLLQADETSAFHVRAWTSALDELESSMHECGVEIHVAHEDAIPFFARLHERWPFHKLISHEEVGSEVTYARDRAVARWCDELHVERIEPQQTGVFRRLGSRDDRGRKWRAWMSRPCLDAPDPSQLASKVVRGPAPGVAPSLAPSARAALIDETNPEGREVDLAPSGHRSAHATLDDFLQRRCRDYTSGISSPLRAFESGSRLSVHLAWGSISSREVYRASQKRLRRLARDPDGGDSDGEGAQSIESFLSRLHWRDHFMQRLESEPRMEFESLHPAFRDFRYPGARHLESWHRGETGWPLVDACMRCAHATGFLNFRMRAMVTSAAVHLLRIPWREVLHPLARLWADYEPGIHISQVQMQAGVVGINALRIYNPQKQLLDQDPEAEFVRRWVPELRDWDLDDIVEHQDHPRSDYTRPLVPYARASRAMREEHRRALHQAGARTASHAVYERHGSRLPPSARRWRRTRP